MIRKIKEESTYVVINDGVSMTEDVETYKDKLRESSFSYIDFNKNIWSIEFNHKVRNFHFPFELRREFNNVLKCYVIECLLSRSYNEKLNYELTIINKMTYLTNFYNREMLQSFKDFLDLEAAVSTKVLYVRTLKKLYSFYKLDSLGFYLSELEGVYKDWKARTKELPAFEDIVTFDNEINKFYQKEFTKEHYKYMPIYLWWAITLKIPMRPEEFCSMKTADLIKQNDEYRLKVKRVKKNEFRDATVNPIEDFLLPQELGLLLEHYINATASINEDEYVFSVSVRKTFYSSNGLGSAIANQNENKKYMTPVDFNRLIDSFYTKIIEDKELKRLTMIDTRHLAISNLRMQGVNPYTIARMAGHLKIETQNHYSNHMATFMESKIRILAEKLSVKNSINSSIITTEDVKRLEIVQVNMTESILNRNSITLKKVGNGYCSDSNFPNNCIQNCTLCPFFRFGNNKEENYKVLLNTAEELNKEYQLELKVFEEYFNKMSSEIDVPIETKERLNTARMKIINLSEKIAVNTYLLENMKEAD